MLNKNDKKTLFLFWKILLKNKFFNLLFIYSSIYLFENFFFFAVSSRVVDS